MRDSCKIINYINYNYTCNTPQLTVAFRSDPQGFVLTDRDRHETITEGITVNRQKQEIMYSTFHDLPNREYYWSLPAKFLKNKVCMSVRVRLSIMRVA